MINVQEIRRNVINVVKNYSDAQVKVRKATSNEPWGPSSTLMSEIADLTYNVVAFSEIMQIIWKRLNDHGKNWRHVYKALVLLEYLIKTGSEKVAQQCRDNLFAIQTLKDFQYFEDSKDQGLSIREKSKMLVNLLKDEEKLKTERIRALKAKERFAQSLSAMGTSLEATEIPRTSPSYNESLSTQGEGSSRASASLNVNPEMESARPQTVGEEELQLQLALAMSKEEAEQEERLRKNDDLRLKLALEESEKAKLQSPETRSAVDDLLSLNPAPLPKGEAVATDPWGSPLTSHGTSLLASPPNKSRPQQPQQLDPWGAPSSSAIPVSFETEKSTFDDPWGAGPSNQRPPSGINDPWGAGAIASSSSPASNDPWNLTSNEHESSKANEIRLGDFIEPSKVIMHYPTNDSIRRTPESFLGSNSNLVNLDALVSKNAQTSTSPNNNPFAAALPAPSNPFQTNKISPPSMNQLRAQSNQVGGITTTASYSNANVLSSLFNSPSISTSPLPINGSSTMISHPTALPLGSAWASFPNGQPQQPPGAPFAPTTFTATSPSQNNPFAM